MYQTSVHCHGSRFLLVFFLTPYEVFSLSNEDFVFFCVVSQYLGYEKRLNFGDSFDTVVNLVAHEETNK